MAASRKASWQAKTTMKNVNFFDQMDTVIIGKIALLQVCSLKVYTTYSS